jgi:hypothetical protein
MISLSVIDIDRVRKALFAAKTVRKRVYPADEAAIAALTELVGKRLEKGKKHYIITIAAIMELGYSERTARSAIEKLRAAGVIRVWQAAKWNPAKQSKSPTIYTLNSDFIAEEVPTTRNGLWLAWYQKGGSFSEYHSVLSALEEEHDRVTADMLMARLVELRVKSEARFRKTNPEGVRLRDKEDAQ